MPKGSFLTEKELDLLKELELDRCKTFEACEKIIDSFRLRQLDKLKTLLARLAREDRFSEDTKKGIWKNDLHAFSRAVVELNNESLENAN